MAVAQTGRSRQKEWDGRCKGPDAADPGVLQKELLEPGGWKWSKGEGEEACPEDSCSSVGECSLSYTGSHGREHGSVTVAFPSLVRGLSSHTAARGVSVLLTGGGRQESLWKLLASWRGEGGRKPAQSPPQQGGRRGLTPNLLGDSLIST